MSGDLSHHLSQIKIVAEREHAEQVIKCLSQSFHIFSCFRGEEGEDQKITVGLVLSDLPSWILSTEQKLENTHQLLTALEKEKEQMQAEINRLKEELEHTPKPRIYDVVLGNAHKQEKND